MRTWGTLNPARDCFVKRLDGCESERYLQEKIQVKDPGSHLDLRTWVVLQLDADYSEALPFTGVVVAVFFLGALACLVPSPPEGLSRVSESWALKGYRRTDCWPVVFSETS